LDVDTTNIKPLHGRRSGSGRGGSDDGYALNSVSPGPQAHSTETLGLQASATSLDAVDAVSSLFGAGGGVGVGIGSKPLPPLRSDVGSPPSPPLADVPNSPPGGDVASRWPVRKQLLGPLGQSGGGRSSGSGADSGAPPGPVLGATSSHSELLLPHVSSAAQLSDTPSASAPSPPTVAWAAPAQRHVPPAASPGLRQPGAPVAPRTSIVVVGPRGRAGGGADDGVAPASAAAVPPLRVPLVPRSGALSSRARAPGVATARPRVAAGSGEGSSVWGSNRLPRPASLATATLIAARRAEAVARTAEAPLSARPAFRGLAWGPGMPDLSATEVDDYDDDDDDYIEPPATQIRPATSPVGAAVLRAGATRGGFSASGGSTAPVPPIGLPRAPAAGPASTSNAGGVFGVRQAWE